ncbi:Ltp family lipoprotein [Dietzia alimentaria]|uniref:Ltp family lipoprotein n=1 Tax=Dietzia alimentaria TaxID=665550 RepID=UPI0002E9F005|nr:Ltp family lipoprotein [Dietzia alimentaria]
MSHPGPQNPYQQPDGPYPPQKAPKKKRGGCMKVGLIVLGIFLLVVILVTAINGSGDNEDSDSTSTITSQTAPAPDGDAEPAPEAEPEQAEQETDVPREFKNALRSADRYLSVSSFSQQGLVDQLQFEDYSPEAAQYAAENVDADWNEQAAKKAEEYMAMSPMSRQGLVDQLVFEKFTPEQAEYGASQAY